MDTEKQQTAVEWLAIQLYEKIEMSGDGAVFNEILEQAKQLDLKQRKEIWDTAHQAGRFEGKGIADENWQTWETYCNENFNYEN